MMFNDNPNPIGSGPVAHRRNMAVSLSTDALRWSTVGHVDLESNGYRISYPDFVTRNGLLYSICSRRDAPKTLRPNIIRGQVSRLIGVT